MPNRAFLDCRLQQQQQQLNTGGGSSDNFGAAPQQEAACSCLDTTGLLFVLLTREVGDLTVGLCIHVSTWQQHIYPLMCLLL